MRIRFLGAAGTVTGSRFLCQARDGTRVLVDCGLFQGYKHLRLLNWRRFPVAPSSIDAVFLTHAHVDHSGFLPVLARSGFRGPVLTSLATRDLCALLLMDSARLAEEDAERANREGFTRHRPARPLFSSRDAAAALRLFRPVATHQPTRVGPFTATFVPNGHLLGSSCVLLDDGEEQVLFSGDLGRDDDVLLPPPEPPVACDRMVLESTYGNRLHEGPTPDAHLEAVVRRVVAQQGVLFVPAFAVGRTQAVLYLLDRLMHEGRVPRIPLFLDSPLAIAASRILRDHADLTRLGRAACRNLERHVEAVTSQEESQALARRRGPFVLVSASGMLTGGRALAHFRALAPSRRNTILLVGHQAGGTRGARLRAGERQVKVHGRMIDVRARIEDVRTLSAHADADGILRWLRQAPEAPRHTYLVHGEPEAADALRSRLETELGWRCSVPFHAEEAGPVQPRRTRAHGQA